MIQEQQNVFIVLSCLHHPQPSSLLHAVCDRRMEHEPLVLSPYKAVGPTSLCASVFNQHPTDDLCRQDGKCSASLIPLRGTPSLSLPDGFILQLENVRWKSALC